MGCTTDSTIEGKIVVVDFSTDICPLAEKIFHATQSNAHAIVFTDYELGPHAKYAKLTKSDTDNSQIPILEIKNSKDVFEAVNKGTIVRLLVHFEEEPQVKKMPVKFWTSFEREAQHKTMMKFAKYALLLQDHVVFEPHFYQWTCIDCETKGFSQAQDHCVSGGQFCSPNTILPTHVTGYDVIMEEVRLLAIDQNYNLQEYMHALYEACPKYTLSTFDFAEQCYTKAMKSANMSTEAVKSTIEESFAGNDYRIASNSLLSSNQEVQNQEKIHTYPSIYINETQYIGELYPEAILDAVCDALDELPEVCLAKTVIKHTEIRYSSKEANYVIIAASIVISILVFICFPTCGFVAYRNWSGKSQREDKVRLNS